MWDRFKDVMSPCDNWNNYRASLSNAVRPVLPYLGIFLKDFTFIEDGNADYLEDARINFDKVMLIGEQLARIEYYQRSDYSTCLTVDNINIIKSLQNLPKYSEEDLEEMYQANKER